MLWEGGGTVIVRCDGGGDAFDVSFDLAAEDEGCHCCEGV